VRERATRDGDGNFVGILCDEESPVGRLEEDSATIGIVEEELPDKAEVDDDMD
jgi:hypothetical protein